MKKYLYTVIINIIISVVVINFLSYYDMVFSIEEPFITLFYRFRGEVIKKNNIIIVDIDRKSMGSQGRWPWKRTKMANLIDSISKYNPIVIGIPILFVNKSSQTDDEAFSNSIENAGNIVLAFSKSQSIFPFNYETESPQKNKFQIGFIEKVQNKKGKVVGIIPEIEDKENTLIKHKAFPYVLVQQFDKTIAENIDRKDKVARINYYGSKKVFKHFSALDILNGKIPPDTIERKIVIIDTSFMQINVDTLFGPMTTTSV